jgi:hypothetical protein
MKEGQGLSPRTIPALKRDDDAFPCSGGSLFNSHDKKYYIYKF